MYTRSYNEEAGEIIIPEKYGGTSFGKRTADEHAESEHVDSTGKNPWENDGEIHTSSEAKSEETQEASAIGQKSSLSAMLSGIFKNGRLSLKEFGKEELLIIATAAFLLFSKEGDKECAIMLLLLLFLS